MADDLDDELRRLFSDDRLDVHVSPDATDAVLRGADRRRRRRSAMATALAVVTLVGAGIGLTQLPPSTDTTSADVLATSLPSTSSSSPPPPSISTVIVTSVVTVNPPPNPPNSTTTGSPTKPRTSVPPSPPPSETAGVGALVLGMSEADALKTKSLVEPSTPADPEGKCVAYATTSVPDNNAVIISPARGIVRLTLPSIAKTQRGIGVGSTVAEVKAAYPAATQSGTELRVEMTGTPRWTYVFETDGATVTTVRKRLNASDCPGV
ncbi:hypothetical protein [Lentzea flava]|uniref:Peptidase propeptide and YPEB domain-containing protein n=1 Tax=Lentzea flava TaxID=103732 RepID=A0ABQ2UF12_9PSEU|nr:hypothetical protein [Lentzea flava]MCP2197694.1 hypothetical protein [Lentzea flava]GGU21528.1 hypothetical protein GCM10010178_12200 [Lentzea flava]